MKTVSFSEFGRNASGYLAEVERGERIVLLHRGRPVAQLIPYSNDEDSTASPAWKRPGPRLRVSGPPLSAAILEEREVGS
ncbi:MAG: type II toxin-antitoxin system Phd/YefM family antitoxin [Chloroflexi bacterium]|nr:type II toxin-antitoxin system Phd/YefM family antitoxin [Chloroflexota bacterium]